MSTEYLAVRIGEEVPTERRQLYITWLCVTLDRIKIIYEGWGLRIPTVKRGLSTVEELEYCRGVGVLQRGLSTAEGLEYCRGVGVL